MKFANETWLLLLHMTVGGIRRVSGILWEEIEEYTEVFSFREVITSEERRLELKCW